MRRAFRVVYTAFIRGRNCRTGQSFTGEVHRDVMVSGCLGDGCGECT